MIYLKIISLLLICYINQSNGVTSATNQMWNSTYTDQLKRHLLLNYDKFARPTEHYNMTNVSLALTVRHIDVDEMKSVLTVYGWIRMQWMDDKLKWNSSDYGDLKTLHLADHEIWQPDIMLYNSATGSAIDHYGNSHLLLQNDGTVLWVPPSQFPVFCELNLKYWPFDSQMCRLILGSWTYDGNSINLADAGIVKEMLVENHEWEIKSMKSSRNVKIYSCCEEPYVDITINITIKRRSPMYEAVVVTPASVIVLMTLAAFWLPPLSGEKIILNGVNAILICCLLMFFTRKLPVMAIHTPLIVLFYSTSFYLVCFSMIISVIVLNLSRNKQAHAVPWIIKKNLDGLVGKLLGLGHLYTPPQQQQRVAEELHNAFDENTITSDDHQMIQQPSEKRFLQQDWILLATAIDRISFLIYSIVFAIVAMIYAV